MKILGLTGRCGSGKNEVAKILRGLGALVLDADEIGHAVLQLPEIRERVAFAFPESLDKETKEISRKVLGDIVFARQEKLLTLNGIVHPALREKLLLDLEQLKQTSSVDLIAINAALLKELNLNEICDAIWTVDADTTAIMGRLRKRGMSIQKSLALMAAQRPSAQYIKEADVIIRNNAELDGLKQQVTVAYKKLLVGTLARPA